MAVLTLTTASAHRGSGTSDTGGANDKSSTHPHKRIPPARPPDGPSRAFVGCEDITEDCSGQKR
jgi:hypothetical protein